MRVAFFCPWDNAGDWLAGLRAAGPEFRFEVWPELADPAAIEAAVVWRPPSALFDELTALKGICIMGAGADHLFAPGMRLPEVPIARLVDPLMAERMASYVLGAILLHHRQFDLYRRQQAAGLWRRAMHKDTVEIRVGILGLGVMGRTTAELLARVGYDVAGWSRAAKTIPGVQSFVGPGGRAALLARSDVLVCLLPLTPATRGILDRATFERLPAGALLVNAARGEHLVEEDLLAALDSGRLAAAVLDVFTDEPLPPEHRFWGHPKVLITPHVASLSHPATGVPQIIETLRRLRSGRRPDHLVERRDYLA